MVKVKHNEGACMRWVLVGFGAAFGAMLRLALAQGFNQVHSFVPLGTLLANVLGGLLMGLVVGWTGPISVEMRWLLATGFLGGLTTFSTFSAETFALLQTGRPALALVLVLIHVVGALLATVLGWWLIQSVQA
jgi:CrcB protein